MAILVAYDGLNVAERALDYSIEYAKAFKTRLYIMSVVGEDVVSSDSALKKAKDVLAHADEKAKTAGLSDAHTVLETGPVTETLLAAATRFKCSAIVVGRHNKSSMDRLILGSVSNKLLNESACTIILVH